jgi:hypothetical protein
VKRREKGGINFYGRKGGSMKMSELVQQLEKDRNSIKFYLIKEENCVRNELHCWKIRIATMGRLLAEMTTWEEEYIILY